MLYLPAEMGTNKADSVFFNRSKEERLSRFTCLNGRKQKKRLSLHATRSHCKCLFSKTSIGGATAVCFVVNKVTEQSTTTDLGTQSYR